MTVLRNLFAPIKIGAMEVKNRLVMPPMSINYGVDEEGYVTAEHAEARGLHVKKLSGTQFRKMLRSGEEIPEWFAFRSVVEVLRAS